MNEDEHITCVRSRIISIFKEVIRVSDSLGCGMEAAAVNPYLLQGLFLKLTGALEQKLKCICWLLASDDLEYRHARYYKGWSLHECSTLNDKYQVYEDILAQINKKEPDYKLLIAGYGKRLLCNVFDEIYNLLHESNVARINQSKFDEFVNIFPNIKEENIIHPKKEFFYIENKRQFRPSSVDDKTTLYGIYYLLYRHRNRCAHNTTSYQMNFPNLKDLRDKNIQKYSNVFMFFAVLILIDEVFVQLFEKYLSIRSVDW